MTQLKCRVSVIIPSKISENLRIKWDKVVFIHCVQHGKLDICFHWVLTLLYFLELKSTLWVSA